MRILCDNCKINCNIMTYKEELEKKLIESNNNLLNNEVIELSESISKLISNCIFCNNNNLRRLKGKYLYGKLYYYGDKHLLVNLYSYIIESIKNRNLIYISMKEEFYERVMDIIVVNKIFSDNIKFKPLENIDFIRNQKKTNIKEAADEFFCYNSNEYNGIRWIVDSDYIGNTFLENDFLGINCNSREFVKNMNVNIVYVFNAYEHMHENTKLIFNKMTNKIDI